MSDARYFILQDKIRDIECFQMLKEADSRKWRYSIKTELDSLSFGEVNHDDIDLRDDFSEIQASNDLLKIVGFIVIENIKIDTIEIFDGQNTIAVFEDVVHFDGTEDELIELMKSLSLNPYYWLSQDGTSCKVEP